MISATLELLFWVIMVPEIELVQFTSEVQILNSSTIPTHYESNRFPLFLSYL